MNIQEVEPLWVLVVEDDPIFQGLVRGWLAAEEDGYRLLVASDLQEALAALERRRCDAVILDLNLPDSRGLDTFYRVQAAAHGAPVVVLTAQEDDALGVEAVRQGAQDFLPKSGIDAEELRRGMRYALERHRLEDLHRRALLHEMEARRLRELDQAKNRFYQAAAHGMRDPLQPLRMGLQMLELDLSERLTPGQKDTLRSLRHCVDDLERLVGGIVDVAGLQTGSLELDRRPVDLGGLVEDALGRWRETAAANRLGLHCVTEHGLVVEADALRIRQVLDHLLDNAVRFTPGGGAIEVEVARCGGEAGLRVRDTGVGVDAGREAHVFDAFRSAGEDGDGHGIGLAFSKIVVEHHGGRIDLRSRPGEGTTVDARFPLLGDL